MNTIKRWGHALMIGLVLVQGAYAAEQPVKKEDSKPPMGCHHVGYEFLLKTLHLLPAAAGEQNSMYFMRNKGNQAVNLYQMRQEESSRSMFLNHVIKPKLWAVFATTETEMKFICTVDEKDRRYGAIVNCADVLTVCEYDHVKFGLNNRGNYWIVDSSPRGSAVQEVIRYGIIPAI